MKRSFIIAAFLLITASAVAQVSGSSVYVGIAMPRKASSAGPVLGYKYQYDLPVAGLGVIGSVDFTLYGADKDLRNATDKAFNFWKDSFNYDDADAKTRHREPINFAVPINFGANYHYSFGRIAPWAEAGIGFAPVFTSKQVYKGEKSESVRHESTNSHGRPVVSHESGTRHRYEITKYKPTVAFSWRIALGAILDEKYSVALSVDGLAKYNQKTVKSEDVKPYWNTSKDSYSRETEGERTTPGQAYVSIRFGYHF